MRLNGGFQGLGRQGGGELLFDSIEFQFGRMKSSRDLLHNTVNVITELYT